MFVITIFFSFLINPLSLLCFFSVMVYDSRIIIKLGLINEGFLNMGSIVLFSSG